MYFFCLASILRIIHIDMHINRSLLFTAKSRPIIRRCYNTFIHVSVDRYLGCVQFGAITKKAATNIHIEVPNAFFSLW